MKNIKSITTETSPVSISTKPTKTLEKVKIMKPEHQVTNSLAVPQNSNFSAIGTNEEMQSNTDNTKRTVEQIIAQSIAELEQINEENSVSNKSESLQEDLSPKVTVGIIDTWGIDTMDLNDT